MGPLRRGLILALLPAPALAEVCDTERPSWDGSPVSAIDEAIALFSSPPVFLLLLATVIAIRFRLKKMAPGVAVLWTIAVSMVAMPTTNSIRLAGITEGCIGSPTLFIALVGALCLGMILYTAPTAKQGDT